MSTRKSRSRSDIRDKHHNEDSDNESKRTRSKTPQSFKSDKFEYSSEDANTPKSGQDDLRRSGRKRTPSQKILFRQEMEKHARSTKNRKSNKRSAIVDDDDDEDDDVDDDDDHNDSNYEMETERLDRPSTLFDVKRDVAGTNMFGFHTPKKRNGMAILAANTPKTPSSAMKSLSLKTQETPKSHQKGGKISGKTPYKLREKIKKGLKRRVQQFNEDDDDDDVESEATDDEDPDFNNGKSDVSSSDEQSDSDGRSSASSDEGAKAQKLTKSTQLDNRSIHVASTSSSRSARLLRRQQISESEFLPQSDNYFTAASNKKVKTSDHTLDRLKSSRLMYDDLFALLRSTKLSDEHRQNTAEMIQDLEQHFAKWMLMLSKGYNLILFGLGSKQTVLQRFCETQLGERPVIIVNGFFPTLTVKDILHSIKMEIISTNINARTDHETVDIIASAFHGSPNKHLFLIINNIDGPMLRKTKDQHILSRLAKIQNIHLLASIDHINAPLMWDQTCMSNYNFLWWDCTTMLPYTNETAFENSVFLQNSGELGLAAMNNVFQSLTTNARGVYMLLVDAQLKNKKDANYQGMAFKDLYHGCRDRFLVSSDLALRTQLTEFVDHHMAKMKRSNDGTEHVYIPIGSEVLELFVKQQKE